VAVLTVGTAGLVLGGSASGVGKSDGGRGFGASVGANAQSRLPTISADGRFVAFESYASNLVADDTNRMVDVFV
jgi:hypothetical protein